MEGFRIQMCKSQTFQKIKVDLEPAEVVKWGNHKVLLFLKISIIIFRDIKKRTWSCDTCDSIYKTCICMIIVY